MNGDHRAILLKFSGNGGSIDYKLTALNNGIGPFGFRDYINPDPVNKIENFMESNNGAHHDSAWNQFHYPDDFRDQNFDAQKSPPDNIEDCDPCNWVQGKADALAYIAANPQKKIVLAGFSYGGGTATFLAEDLQHLRQVEGVFLTDPVGPGLVGASRAGIVQRCNYGLATPVDSNCRAGVNPIRSMNGNIKTIFASGSTLPVCGTICVPIPADNGVFNFDGWTDHIVGPFLGVLFALDHSMGNEPPLQTEFIGFLNQNHNAKPTISILSETNYQVVEGESFQVEIETLSEDPFAFAEHRGDMRLFPRFDSLNNGIEPFSLIENGSFETGTVFGDWDEQSGQFVTLGVGDDNLAPWEITSGTVDHVYRLWVVPDGSKSLDMSGALETGDFHTISQTFDTIEGETNYRVNFDVSANPLCGLTEMGLEVQAGDTPLEPFTVSNAGRSPTIMNWQHKSYLFSAAGPTATLQFTGTDDTGCGVTLDNVVVTKASSQETGTVLKTSSIEKHATFLININGDGPGTLTRPVWVEDNGWPCDDCTSTDDSIDGGATGKWNSDEITITVISVPPVPKIEVLSVESSNFRFSANDVSSADQAAGFVYEVDWGDGNSDSFGTLEGFPLVENGSFESGPDPGQFVTLGVGDDNLAPWEITSGTVDHIQRFWFASTGVRSLDMSGAPGPTPHEIRQPIETVSGEDYLVNFDVSANPFCTPRVMGLNVQAGDDPLQHYTTNNFHQSPFMPWLTFSYAFTATSDTTTLVFAGTDASGCGVALDNVEVNSNPVLFDEIITSHEYATSGTYTVTLTATDKDGDSASVSTDFLVAESIPPELQLPDDITTEATSIDGRTVEFTVTATDNIDPNPTVDCAPSSGSVFPLGTTTVTCTATDASENTSEPGTFTVTVQDTTPPEVTDPSNVEEEATGIRTPLTEEQLGTATATDIFEIVDIYSDAPDDFPLGTTEVHWFAEDANGNVGSTETQLVTIVDTTPPDLTVPADDAIDAVDPFGSTFTFSATATDLADPSPTVDCTPTSGSVFPLGTTTVTCTATDASENTSEPGTFNVTVQVSAATFDGFTAIVESMELQKGIENSLVSKIDAAAKSFDKGKTKTLINQLETFVNEVNAQDKKKLSEEQAALLLECADFLIDKLSEN